MAIKKGTAVMVGVGVAAAAAAAYFLTGERGEKNRAAMKQWMSKAKKDVLSQLGKVKELTQDTYNAIVDEVVGRYEAVKGAAPEEIETLKEELKGHWDNISKHMAEKAPTPKKPAAKAAAKKTKK